MSYALRVVVLAAFVLVMWLGPAVAYLRYVWCILANHERAWRILIGFDQLGNVGTNGSEDETISSRAARARSQGRRWGCVLCRVLDWFEKDHCSKSAGV